MPSALVPFSIPLRLTRTAVIAIAAGLAFAAGADAELAHHQVQPFASAGDYVIEARFGAALALDTIAWSTLRSSGALETGRGRTGAARMGPYASRTDNRR